MTISFLQYIASAENGLVMAGPAGPVPAPIICRVQDHNHVWQSWVEIEHCSVGYFDRGTAFEAL